MAVVGDRLYVDTELSNHIILSMSLGDFLMSVRMTGKSTSIDELNSVIFYNI